MEENRNTITYDENWQSVSEPETPVIIAAEDGETDEAPPREKYAVAAPRQLLLSMQLVTCILLAVAAFALKNIGGEVYEAARGRYVAELNETLLFDGAHGLEELLPAATADEA